MQTWHHESFWVDVTELSGGSYSWTMPLHWRRCGGLQRRRELCWRRRLQCLCLLHEELCSAWVSPRVDRSQS